MPNAEDARELELTTWLESALAHVLHPDAMTEPMLVSELAEYFGGIERHAMSRLLKTIPGVQRTGRKGMVRVPILAMPPGYLADVALRAVAGLEQFGAHTRKPVSIAARHAYSSSP